ncbi:hypothetical protein APY03_5412 [Variovorax sp. WDL1]|nr:hypothetical protein APY03_5412 [Variovorax sp. WDL1]
MACGQPVNELVLSGVRAFVLSGAARSCYQAYQWSRNPCATTACASPNVSNVFNRNLTIVGGRALWKSRGDARHAAGTHRAKDAARLTRKKAQDRPANMLARSAP